MILIILRMMRKSKVGKNERKSRQRKMKVALTLRKMGSARKEKRGRKWTEKGSSTNIRNTRSKGNIRKEVYDRMIIKVELVVNNVFSIYL